MSSLIVGGAPEPVVTIVANRPVTDSRDVAAYFEKKHQHVLEAIRNLHCSDPFRETNFRPFKNKDLTGEHTSHVLMTKDGFTFLVMGFTGPKAGAFKEAYIARFNQIEAALQVRKATDAMAMLDDPATLRRLLLDKAEKVLALEPKVEALEPKAEALDRIATAQGSLCITDAAKALQTAPRALAERLRAERWTYRRDRTGRDVAMQARLAAGDLEMKVIRVERTGMPDLMTEQVRITSRGLTKLASIINPASSAA